MYKIIGADQKIYGPVSFAQVRQWQAEGRINHATLLQAEGSNDWKPLSSLPEFGTPPVVTMPPAAPCARNNMAMAGLIFGVLSNLCCCFGVVFAILGIIFSVIALSRHEVHPQAGGKCMAIAGLIASVIGLSWHSLLPVLGGFPFNHPFLWHHHWRY